jgi:hypothetical protein
MPLELYRDKHHACYMFTNLIEEDGQAVQANQFLIVDGGTGAIIDPGGNLAYNELYMGMSKHFSPQHLSYLIASHADPDIIASLDRSSPRSGSALSRTSPRRARPKTASSACLTGAAAFRSDTMSCGCCQPISCTRRATSISTIQSAAFFSPAIWACP